MKIQKRYKVGEGYLELTLSGEWSLAELEAITVEATAEVRKAGLTRLLVDATAMPVPEFLHHLHTMAEYSAPLLRGIRLAVIVPDMDAGSFYEDSSVNRGTQAQVFADRAAALDWLLSDRLPSMKDRP